MSHGFPLPAGTLFPARLSATGAQTAARSAGDGVHYRTGDRIRGRLALAVVLSLSLHAALLLGVRRPEPKAYPAAAVETITVMLAPPQGGELEEEPEPASNRGDDAPPDLALPVPMQADVPSLPRPDDFVQALDFSSLLEKPDLGDARISVIPENIRRGLELRSRIGAIFSIAELDRHPEAVVQVAPVFPFALKRDLVEGRVVVEFVVDTEGRVVGATAVEGSHPGFEEAAVTGVTRWKFRPGQRNGRPVNTRMRVPILFRLADADQ